MTNFCKFWETLKLRAYKADDVDPAAAASAVMMLMGNYNIERKGLNVVMKDLKRRLVAKNTKTI